jgi:magnesium transporter
MLSYHTRRTLSEEFEEISTPFHTDGVWLHGAAVTDKEVDTAIDRYQLDGNIVRDVFDRHELPRVEFDEKQTLYMFLRVAWSTRAGEVRTAPLLAIAAKQSFVTLSRTKLCLPREVIRKRPQLCTTDTHMLLLSTFANVVTGYEELIHHMAEMIALTKGRLRKHEATNSDFLQFMTIEENLAIFSYNLSAMLSVAERLRSATTQPFNAKELEALDDIILHIEQLMASVSTSERTVASVQNAYSTVANNTLNQRMKWLTIITLLVTIPNVFYGMYGMNVALPFAREPWAYGAVVGFTVAIMVVLVIFIRRAKV